MLLPDGPRRGRGSTSGCLDRQVTRVLWLVLRAQHRRRGHPDSVGAATGALSLLADGIHALLDASSNVVGLVGIAFASRPADAGHPYGHRRFETLAAVSIGLLILEPDGRHLAWNLEGLLGHRTAPASHGSRPLVFVTILANFGISRFEARRGAELRSALLEADAGHTLSDTFGATAVLISFGAIALGFESADMLAAVVVCLLIGRTAWNVLGSNLGVLADSARLDPHRVHEVARRFWVAEVRGQH